MRRIKYMISIGWLAVHLSSCETKEVITSGFFDSRSYFMSQTESLSNGPYSLEKTMITDGLRETVLDSSPEWETELLPFIELDITKAAMASSYKVDTLQKDQEIKISYRAIDEYVSIRQLEIVKDSLNEISSVFAIVRSKNPYHSSADTLEFEKANGYRISALSEPQIGEKIQFTLIGKIIKR
jgi:hypothetical protein